MKKLVVLLVLVICPWLLAQKIDSSVVACRYIDLPIEVKVDTSTYPTIAVIKFPVVITFVIKSPKAQNVMIDIYFNDRQLVNNQALQLAKNSVTKIDCQFWGATDDFRRKNSATIDIEVKRNNELIFTKNESVAIKKN